MAEPETTTKETFNRSWTPEPRSSVEPIVPEANPEPLPDWDVALEAWKGLWELHFVGFGLLFLGVALFSSFCVVRIKRRKKGMTLGNYFLAVCLMLMLFSISRTLFLALDPYESHTVLHLPVIVVRIIFAIGYPCLTSALSLIHVAFLEVNKLRLISRRLQSIKFLICMIASHFVVVLFIYTLITFSPKFARLLILCQTILISWWLVLALCFLYSGWKVNWEAYITAKFFRKQESKERAVSSGSNDSTVDFVVHQPPPPKGAQKIAKISGLVSLLAVMYTAAELYSLFSLYNLYRLEEEEGSVDHWSWWGYQTVTRLLDFLFCLVIAYVIFPSTQTEKKQHSHSVTGDSSVRFNRNIGFKPTGSVENGLDAV